MTIKIPNFIYLAIVCMLSVMAMTVCARKDSVAQAAETAGPVTGAPTSVVAESKAVDQVKHQIMAFDLEGLSDDGSKKWDVRGKSAESVTENQVKLNDVVASSYGKNTQATITADEGLYDRSKNNVRLEQNVKAVIENTRKSTSEFIGLSETGQSNSNKAAGLDADKARKTKTTITCDAEVEFNYDKNQGYFNKNVHVVNEEGTIDSDRMTVFLDPRIRRGENITYSDKATYISADKKIVLSGQPKLVIYQEGDLQANFMGTDKK
jgi:hypothetical protein